MTGVHYRILGPLEVERGEHSVAVGSAQLRALLCLLLIHANEAMPADHLIEEWWGEPTPARAVKRLQVAVARLRRALDRDAGAATTLQTAVGGYRLVVARGALDADVFQARVQDGRHALAAGDAAQAVELLREALSMWRGPALADAAYEAFAQGEIRRLEELRFTALEARVDADLELGQHATVIGELEALIAAHPTRERLTGQLMLAYYRSGRQAEALDVYGRTRVKLDADLGLQPGRALAALQAQILEHAPALELPTGGASVRDAGRALRLPAALRSVPTSAYVGRSDERARLSDALRGTRGGARRLVFIGGEPGVGKTRLAAHTVLEAHATGFAVSWGAAAEDLHAPYGPWIDALSQLVDSAPDALLAAHVATHGGAISRLVPSLEQRVGDIPAAPRSDPETDRYLLFAAVAGLLEGLCDARPVALVLDDLQWADKQSLALLLHVASATPRAEVPLLILVTYRDTELRGSNPLPGVLADLHRIEGGVDRILLAGLGVDEVAELMASRAGHDLGADGLRLAAELTDETGGNPFFVGEILRHLGESGAIAPDGAGRWRVQASSAGLDLPQSVREVVMSRVRRLGEEAEAILSDASVIGRTFDVELLELLVNVDEDELLAALEGAIDGAVIVESPELTGRFSFAHVLIKQALYERLSAVRRRRMHLKIAQALEQLGGTEQGERVGELAHHWGEAGPAHAGTAVRYARLAGQRALDQLAPEDALRSFRKARDLLPAEGSEQVERCDVLLGLGEAMRQLGDPAFRDLLVEASTIATREGDQDRLIRTVLANTLGPENTFGSRGGTAYGAAGTPDPRRVELIQHALAVAPSDSLYRPRMMAILGKELYYGGEPERALELSKDALSLARGGSDRRELARVMAFTTSISPIAPLEAHFELVDELARLAEELDDPELRFRAANALFVYGMHSGDPVQLDAAVETMQALADAIGQPMLCWMALWAHSAQRMIAGDMDEAELLAEQALAAVGRQNRPQALLINFVQRVSVRFEQDQLGGVVDELEAFIAANPELHTLQMMRGFIAAETGRPGDARQVLDRAAQRGYPFPFDRTQAFILARCADIALKLDARDRAAELYERLLPFRAQFATSAGITSRGSIELNLGRLASMRGHIDIAHEHFAAAQHAHDRLRAPLFQARTSLAWGEALLDQGGEHGARRATAFLETALDLARRHGSTAIEREVVGLQARIPDLARG